MNEVVQFLQFISGFHHGSSYCGRKHDQPQFLLNSILLLIYSLKSSYKVLSKTICEGCVLKRKELLVPHCAGNFEVTCLLKGHCRLFFDWTPAPRLPNSKLPKNTSSSEFIWSKYSPHQHLVLRKIQNPERQIYTVWFVAVSCMLCTSVTYVCHRFDMHKNATKNRAENIVTTGA
jgi:hypothetical protein